MTALNDQIPSLKDAGIRVLAVTAEPGGEDAVRERLVERDVPPLDFAVRSDPDHVFLRDPQLTPNDDVFVTEPYDWDVSGPYTMVQPALIAYDGDGVLLPECTWSWKTMGVADHAADARVTQSDGKKVLLVTLRPVMSDLKAAVTERRPVKLASTNEDW